MNADSIISHLESNGGIGAQFKGAGTCSHIRAWKYKAKFILTWEEWPDGHYYDEHLYTRDERHSFKTAKELVAFLNQNKVDLTGIIVTFEGLQKGEK